MPEAVKQNCMIQEPNYKMHEDPMAKMKNKDEGLNARNAVRNNLSQRLQVPSYSELIYTCQSQEILLMNKILHDLICQKS